MITPAMIQEKQFSTAVRGYKQEEVDKFLDEITKDLEYLLGEYLRVKDELLFLQDENAELKKSLLSMKTENDKYRDSENSVAETLEAVKILINDITSSADKRANLIVGNAEMKAELIRNEARLAGDKIQEENQYLRERFTLFRRKYKDLLEGELRHFDSITMDFFNEAEFDAFEDNHEYTAVKTFRDIGE